MKQGNRDTNIVEQADISQISKLDDAGPLSDSESFFDDALVDIVRSQRELYGQREKANVHQF